MTGGEKMLFVKRKSLFVLSFIFAVLMVGCGKGGVKKQLFQPNQPVPTSTAAAVDASKERLLELSPEERLEVLRRRLQEALGVTKGISRFGTDSWMHKVETGDDKEKLQVVKKDGGLTREWTLSFLELLQGDINLDGYVGDPEQESPEADLAQLNVHLGHVVNPKDSDPYDEEIDRVTTRDGEIGIEEVSSLAENIHCWISPLRRILHSIR